MSELEALEALRRAVKRYEDSGVESEHVLYSWPECPHCQAEAEMFAALAALEWIDAQNALAALYAKEEK